MVVFPKDLCFQVNIFVFVLIYQGTFQIQDVC